MQDAGRRLGISGSFAIGVVRGEARWSSNFGGIGPGAIYEIGSVTKVLTALLLSTMVEDDIVSLDDKVANFVPPGIHRAKWTEAVSLLQLATHTSGLPRVLRRVWLRALWQESGPYGNSGLEELFSIELYRRKAIQDQFRYSNYGFAVLGQLLAVAGSSSYGDLLSRRVLGPLGLSESSISTSNNTCKSAVGHDRRGSVVRSWDLGSYISAGGVCSTIDDMIRLLQAHLGFSPPSMASVIRAVLTKHVDVGPGESVGLGWHPRDRGDSSVAWHNGGTNGFGSFVALDVESNIGLAILYDSSHQPMIDSHGFEMLDTLRVENG
jgi:CubicO group peptidase (beta-lactamase class C family)